MTRLTDLNNIQGSGSTSPVRRKKNGTKLARRLIPLESGKSSTYEVNGTGSKPKKIAQKKDLIDAVRKMQLTNTGNVNGKDKTGGNNTGGELSENDSTSKEVETLEDGVNMTARKYNEQRMLGDKKQQTLDKLKDELATLKLETEMLTKMQNKESDGALKIIKLTDNIETCADSMEERLHQRKQFEHMVNRLEKTKLNVDAHVQALETTVNETEKEYKEVKLLFRDLEAGRSKAYQELLDYEQEVELERKDMARVLGDKESEAKNAQRMEAWRLSRIQQREEMAAELRGDLGEKDEEKLLNEYQNRNKAFENLKVENREMANEAATMEELFTKIKQVTGTNALEDIVAKFIGQKANRTALEKEKNEAERRLANAKAQKEASYQEFLELKASGAGGSEMNRELQNRLEQELLQAKASFKVTKAAAERLEDVLSSIQQGMQGIITRLSPYKNLVDSHEELGLQRTGVATIDNIASAELKLTKMIEVIGQQAASNAAFGVFDGENRSDDYNGRGENEGAMTWEPMTNDDPKLHKNNVRVAASMNVGASNNGPRARFGDIPSINDDFDDDEIDDMVPSREFLKISSDRQFNEILRKREFEERRKLVEERGCSEAEKSSKSLKQQQQIADRRLCTVPPGQNAGIPPGVSAKDDALTKSKAFLTQIPDFM